LAQKISDYKDIFQELFSNRRNESRPARLGDCPLHDPDFFLRKIVEVVNQTVDPAVGWLRSETASKYSRNHQENISPGRVSFWKDTTPVMNAIASRNTIRDKSD
jgi:hypothetical protein